MINLQHIQQNFGRAARQYDAHATLQRDVLARTVQCAKRYLDNANTVIDVGGGTGQLASFITHDETQLTLCDASFEMCQQAGLPDAVTADLHNLPFVTSYADVYFSSLAWQWSDYLKQASKEACRVVAPDGVVIISTLSEGSLGELSNAWENIGQENRMLSFYACDTYEKAMEDAGLEVIESVTKPIIQRYASVKELLRSIKAIGASYSQNKAPLTKGILQKLEAHYPATQAGVEATWQWSYLVAQKRGGV